MVQADGKAHNMRNEREHLWFVVRGFIGDDVVKRVEYYTETGNTDESERPLPNMKIPPGQAVRVTIEYVPFADVMQAWHEQGA